VCYGSYSTWFRSKVDSIWNTSLALTLRGKFPEDTKSHKILLVRNMQIVACFTLWHEHDPSQSFHGKCIYRQPEGSFPTTIALHSFTHMVMTQHAFACYYVMIYRTLPNVHYSDTHREVMSASIVNLSCKLLHAYERYPAHDQRGININSSGTRPAHGNPRWTTGRNMTWAVSCCVNSLPAMLVVCHIILKKRSRCLSSHCPAHT